MDYGALPPEVNSARMYAGPGAGPMLAAASAWDGLAAELQSTAAATGSVVSGLTDESWRGVSSTSMAAAVAPYLTWMSATAAQLEQVAVQARAAAAAYEGAFAMTVPPALIAANRAQLMALMATNILGQNTPAIMATEALYAEMWAQDAAAMYGYAASSAAASTLAPFSAPKSTTNPAGVTGQSAAAVHAAGSHAQNVASTSLSQVPQQLQGLSQPTQSASGGLTGNGAVLASSGVSGASGPLSALTSLAGSAGGGVGKSAGSGASSGLGALDSLVDIGSSSSSGVADLGSDAAGVGSNGGSLGAGAEGLGTGLTGVGTNIPTVDPLFGSGGMGHLAGLNGMNFAPGLSGPTSMGPIGFGTTSSAVTIGQASSVGGLSVPHSWPDGSPAAGSVSQPSAMAVPSNGFAAAPAASATGSAPPKVTFPALVEREADGLQRIGLRANMLPRPLVG